MRFVKTDKIKIINDLFNLFFFMSFINSWSLTLSVSLIYIHIYIAVDLCTNAAVTTGQMTVVDTVNK